MSWVQDDGQGGKLMDGDPPTGWKMGPHGYTASGADAPQAAAPQRNTPEQEAAAQQAVKDQAAQAAQDAAAAKAKQDYNNHFNYGGYAGGAQDSSTFFQHEGINSQYRPGEQINTGVANADRTNSMNDRQLQRNTAGLLYGRATGQVPLISQMQADRQMGQAAATQTSAAASARGPAGLALAQQGAAANTAAMQSNISNQAQINGSQEQLSNANAAVGAYSGIRGQDAAQQSQDFGQASDQAHINAAQRQANDQYSQGMYGNSIDVNKAQLGAQGNQIGIQAGQQQAQAALAAQKDMHSQDRTDKYIGYTVGAGGMLLGVGGMALLGGGTKGAGNPVDGGGVGDLGSLGQPGGGGGGEEDFGYNSGGGGEDGDPNDPWGNGSDVTSKQNIRPLNAIRRDDAGMMAMVARLQQEKDAQQFGLMAQGPAVGRDPVTAKFSQGLAPSSYDYRPGFPGTSPGHKVGPMAQNMASNDITGTAIRQNPNTGLLAIDNNDGLKVALGGVGHLAQKQQITDAEVAKLKAAAAGMQQNTAAQSQGLLGPSQPQQAAPEADPRLVEARRLLGDTQEQGTGLLAQGPSVGRTYLDYVRGQ